MIEAARKLLAAQPIELQRRVSFDLLDVPSFAPIGAYSVIFSNATFQWIPTIARCLPRASTRSACWHDHRADARQ